MQSHIPAILNLINRVNYGFLEVNFCLLAIASFQALYGVGSILRNGTERNGTE